MAYAEKSQADVLSDLESDFTTEDGGVLSITDGSRIKILLTVIANAIAHVYRVLRTVWFNIFPQTADREALYWWYQTLGLTWDDPTLENARSEVLGHIQQKAVGTEPYYEADITRRFPQVTQVLVTPGYRRANGVRLHLLSRGAPVSDAVVNAVQTYYDTVGRKAMCQELYVTTGWLAEGWRS